MNIVYEIFDPITNKKYIGSKKSYKGKGTYLGSSTDKEMILIKKERPETLILTILEDNILEENLRDREEWWQRKFNVVPDPMYWNKRYANSWDLSMLGRSHSTETREKISKSQKGKIISKEQREKMSITLKNKDWDNYFTEDGKASLIQNAIKSFKGKPKSEDHKKKLSELKLGTTLSEDHKTTISKAMKELYDKGSIINGRSKKINCSNGKQYNSITEAAKEIGYQRYNISSVLNTDSTCVKGLKWWN